VATMNLPSLAEVQAERANRNFYYYVQKAWHVADPGNPFIDNWHVGLICEYLQALYDLQIQNLIINIGPGYAKSLISSVLFPTWVWVKDPVQSFLCGSYDGDLAMRDAVRSRRVITSEWYQERFGDRFELSGDQNVKSRYENTKSGQRISVGINSGIIGHRANFLVWDDPLNPRFADSDDVRTEINAKIRGMIGTRGADPSKVRRLMIMQRLHEDDPVGHVLKLAKEDENMPKFEHLVLPVRYEPNRFFSSIGLADPRTEPGELLFPQLFDDKSVRQQASLLGERDAAAQQQQRPAPKGGYIYLRKWWEGENRYHPADRSYYNKSIGRWLSWDTALKDEEQNDSTALTVWDLLPDYRILLRFAWWRKLQFPQLAKAIQDEAARWNYDEKLRGIIIEDKASGISALQTLRQGNSEWLAGLLVPYDPGRFSKVARSRQASLWCERGCVLLPDPADEVPWLLDYEELLFDFPTKVIKDPVDSTSQAILHLENLLAEGWRARTGQSK
jgi:phage terminase large subunit-like protein